PASSLTLDNLEPIAGPPWRRRLFRMSALSTFDGTLLTMVTTGNGESGFDSGEGA
uniref:Uncharacterized protein n=1 Tax=Oryzias latipes TaxID=8090 RepID=A0A3B3I0J0_ORYLA